MLDIDVAREAAAAGADVVAAALGGAFTTEYKGHGNPVTAVDRAAEAAILSVIARRRPDDAVLAEEGGGAGWGGGRVWIVDPLDGTVNFVHGIPQVAVSVAVYEDGAAQAGVVVDVARGEVFAASAGGGATRSGLPIKVSVQDHFVESLLATGFPYDRHLHAEAYATAVGVVLAGAQDLRRMGSAALDLAWVACGRYEGYWEYGLAPWDAAAGALLVGEAGGRVTDPRGGVYRLDAAGIIATNGRIHEAVVEAVRR